MISKPRKYVNGFCVTLPIINDLVSQIQSIFSNHKKLTNTVLLISLLRPKSESESHSVVSDSLQPHGLYSTWNSPGQNTGVGSLSLLQGIFPSQGSNPGLLHCRRILYQLSHKGSPSRQPISSPGDPPNLGIEQGSPALQADSLPAELPRKPINAY